MFLNQVSNLLDSSLKKVEQYETLLQLGYEEMQKWQDQVEQREQIIKSILDSSSDIILTIDDIGQITEFNRTAERLIQLKKNDVMGRSILSILSDCRPKKILIDFLNNKTNENEALFRDQLSFVSGVSFPAEILFSSIEVAKKRFYSIYVRDLTEEFKNKLEIDNSRSLATQSAKMAALGEMAGGIAHEINTPLAVIIMNAELIKSDINDQEINPESLRVSAQMIEDTSYRISKIIKGLKRFSRNDDENDFEAIEISTIIEDAVDLCKQKFLDHRIQLILPTLSSGWVLNGKPVPLAQVLLNLLNNSFDAVQSCSEKWVKIDLDQNDETYIIKIIDSGEGISPKIKDKIMNPFFTTKPVGSGTGLGLSISKGIIESHAGTFTYDENSLNTCFIIKLPKLRVA